MRVRPTPSPTLLGSSRAGVAGTSAALLAAASLALAGCGTEGGSGTSSASGSGSSASVSSPSPSSTAAATFQQAESSLIFQNGSIPAPNNWIKGKAAEVWSGKDRQGNGEIRGLVFAKGFAFDLACKGPGTVKVILRTAEGRGTASWEGGCNALLNENGVGRSFGWGGLGAEEKTIVAVEASSSIQWSLSVADTADLNPIPVPSAESGAVDGSAQPSVPVPDSSDPTGTSNRQIWAIKDQTGSGASDSLLGASERLNAAFSCVGPGGVEISFSNSIYTTVDCKPQGDIQIHTVTLSAPVDANGQPMQFAVKAPGDVKWSASVSETQGSKVGQ